MCAHIYVSIYLHIQVYIYRHICMCAHTNISLELPFPLELKSQWNLLTIYSTNACEAGGIGIAAPFHNKIVISQFRGS